MVDHVTLVEVKVEVVLVWAPVVVGCTHPKLMQQLSLTQTTWSFVPLSVPTHFPPRYSGQQPRLRTPRDADHSTCLLLLGTASNVLFARATQHWLQQLRWAGSLLGHPGATSLRANGLHLSQQPDAHPRQSGVPQPLNPSFAPKVDLHLFVAHAHAAQSRDQTRPFGLDCTQSYFPCQIYRS